MGRALSGIRRRRVNGVQVTTIDDPSYADGYVGMAQFGPGRTLFRDLRVEGLP